MGETMRQIVVRNLSDIDKYKGWNLSLYGDEELVHMLVGHWSSTFYTRGYTDGG